jgi:2-hydroxychromene-2-carboxylate isomerase
MIGPEPFYAQGRNVSTTVFYFDFLSPFSYFAWYKITSSQLIENIEYKPVVLAKLLNHVGQKGPGEIDSKREFLFRQCLRIAKKFAIPFMPPLTHPFNPLYALRLATVACAGSNQSKVIEALWQASWQMRIDMGDPDQLKSCLIQKGLDAEKLMELSFSSAAKQEIKSNTQEAINAGCFGVPSFIYQNELFWGQDSLEDLALTIKGENTFDHALYQEMLASTPRAAAQQL